MDIQMVLIIIVGIFLIYDITMGRKVLKKWEVNEEINKRHLELREEAAGRTLHYELTKYYVKLMHDNPKQEFFNLMMQIAEIQAKQQQLELDEMEKKLSKN